MSLLNEQFKRAEEMYLDLENPSPDLYKIAEELGLEGQDVYRASLSGNWIEKRRRKQAESTSAIVPASERLEAAVEQNDVVAVSQGLFMRDIEFVTSRERALINYLDELMVQGKLGDKAAVAYLKLITEISGRAQKRIDDAKKGAQADDAKVREFMEGLTTKAQALRVLKHQRPVDPTVVETKQSIFQRLDSGS